MEHQENQREPEDSETPWTVPPLAPSWDVDMATTQRPPSPWPEGVGSLRGFSRPPPVPENPLLEHTSPSCEPRPEDQASNLTGIFLGQHHDPGPGQLTKSANPSLENPEEVVISEDPQPSAEPETLNTPPNKTVVSERKALRPSASYPLVTCKQSRATWPQWHRWKTVSRTPAPLAPTRAPGSLLKAGKQLRDKPGRFAVVMPQVRGLSSFQQKGSAPLQPPEHSDQDPEHGPATQACSLRWPRLWSPADTHSPWPRIHTLSSPSPLRGHGGDCQSPKDLWKKTGSRSWQNKVWRHKSEGGVGSSGLGTRTGGSRRSHAQPWQVVVYVDLCLPSKGGENCLDFTGHLGLEQRSVQHRQALGEKTRYEGRGTGSYFLTSSLQCRETDSEARSLWSLGRQPVCREF